MNVLAAAIAVLLGGCATLNETYIAETTTMLEGDGVRIFEDLEQDAWGGATFQYRASNMNDVPVCVQVTMNSGAQTSGHSMGSIIRVPPGETVEIGYVIAPAQFDLSSVYWGPQSDGSCGYPPPE
jgi:hypothetical protein